MGYNSRFVLAISRFQRLSVFLDDQRTHVVAGLVVVLVVGSVAVRELGALPAAAEHALKRQKKIYIKWKEIEKIMENIVYYNNLAKPNKVLHLWKILKEL